MLLNLAMTVKILFRIEVNKNIIQIAVPSVSCCHFSIGALHFEFPEPCICCMQISFLLCLAFASLSVIMLLQFLLHFFSFCPRQSKHWPFSRRGQKANTGPSAAGAKRNSLHDASVGEQQESLNTDLSCYTAKPTK